MKYRCEQCSYGRVKTHCYPDGSYNTGDCLRCDGTGFIESKSTADQQAGEGVEKL